MSNPDPLILPRCVPPIVNPISSLPARYNPVVGLFLSLSVGAAAVPSPSFIVASSIELTPDAVRLLILAEEETFNVEPPSCADDVMLPLAVTPPDEDICPDVTLPAPRFVVPSFRILQFEPPVPSSPDTILPSYFTSIGVSDLVAFTLS